MREPADAESPDRSSKSGSIGQCAMALARRCWGTRPHDVSEAHARIATVVRLTPWYRRLDEACHRLERSPDDLQADPRHERDRLHHLGRLHTRARGIRRCVSSIARSRRRSRAYRRSSHAQAHRLDRCWDAHSFREEEAPRTRVDQCPVEAHQRHLCHGHPDRTPALAASEAGSKLRLLRQQCLWRMGTSGWR